MTLDELKLNYRRTFESDDGKVVLEDLKKRCYFMQTTHQPADPNESAFLEGQRFVILNILHFIETNKKDISNE